MKLAIVVGHNERSRGAVRMDTGETEFEFNSRLAAAIMRRQSGLDVRVFLRRPGLGYSKELAAVYAEVDVWGADASIELHFNGSEHASASGTETLSSGTERSLILAANVQREIVNALGLTDRGVKTRSGSDRGGKSLVSGSAPAILIEPFFGSSSKGTSATDQAEELNRLAGAILHGAALALLAFPRDSLAGSRTLEGVQKTRTNTAKGLLTAGSAVVAQVASAVVGDADTAIEAAGIGSRLAEFMPWLGAGLTAICVFLFIANRITADKIEDARLDDHVRGVR